MSGTVPALEMAFFRNFFGWVFIMPLVARAGFGVLKTQRLKMHMVRAFFGTGAMSFWFVGLSMIPLSEATALSFTVPLFTTLGAALLLGETVRVHRWMALVVGFIGALIIIRPGFQTVEPGQLVILASSAFISGALLSVKKLSSTEHPMSIVFYMGVFMTPMSLVAAFPVWVWPQPDHYIWLVAMGMFATTGQLFMANAMKVADASVSMPFNFSNMIFASLIGYVFFGELADIWVWAGAILIFTSTFYIVHREAKLNKARETIVPRP